MTTTATDDWSADSVALRLARPAVPVPLEALLDRWFHHKVMVACAVPPGRDAADLAADPALPGRVRGAWGRRLMDSASVEALAGRPCPWSPPCAYDILFRERRLLAGLEMPKPFVIAVEAAGPRLLAVTLTLFGFATDWLDGAAEALVAALRGGLALDPVAGSAAPPGTLPTHRHPFEPLDCAVVNAEAVDLPPAPPQIGLEFRTPLCLRREGGLAPAGPAFLSSLGNRLSLLARWQDAEVMADWRGLKAHAATLRFDTSGLRPVRWHRASARQDGRRVPMEGLAGTLRLSGDLAPVWPLLVLGATAHVGSHAALGLGRYVLTD